MKKKKRAKVKKFLILVTVVGAFTLLVSSSGLIKVNVVNSENSNYSATNYVVPVAPISLEQIKAKSSKSLILFSSTWCGSCLMLTDHLKELVGDAEDILSYTLDLEQNRDLAATFNVALSPSIVLIDGQKTETIQEVRIEQLQEIFDDFVTIGVR